MPNFQIESKRFFLTYPHYGESGECESFFKRQPGIQCFIIASECHADGTAHLHIYAEYTTRLRTRNERYFDVNQAHPNIQAVRSKTAVLEYVCKDRNYIARKKLGDDWSEWKLKLKRNYGDLITQSDTKTDFMENAKEWFPKDFILSNDRLQLYADKYYKAPVYEPRYTIFRVPVELTAWVWQYIFNTEERPMSLIVVSPTRYGKTEWARSFAFKHWYMGGQFNLDQFNSEADYGVLDDLSPEYFKSNYKQFLGCQKEFSCTDKYRKKVNVTWGKPCIWLCNNKAYREMANHWDMDWVEGNSTTVVLTEKLY